jgi:hypothetical protein
LWGGPSPNPMHEALTNGHNVPANNELRLKSECSVEGLP